MADALFDLPEARKGTSISGVGSGRAITHDWITPRFIIEALGGADSFDLDPCQSPTQPWLCARRGIVRPVDGLAEPWGREARVWCNPPYNVHASLWLAKLARHASGGGSGTALVFARTETEMFFDHVWGVADAVLFLEGRLHFHYPDGRRAEANAGGPSCVIAYGKRCAQFLACSGLPGALVGEANVLRKRDPGVLLDALEAAQ
jgi:hypothetical protein